MTLVQSVEELYRGYDTSTSVRQKLAVGLLNAIVHAPDSEGRLALSERLKELHDRHGHEPVVRYALARTLLGVTVVEHDPVKRLAIADKIQAYHDTFGQDAGIRAQLAKALCNVSAVAPDLADRKVIVSRLERLYQDFGEEPAVREALAGGIANAAQAERELARCYVAVGRLHELWDRFGHEIGVDEQLSRARYYTALLEPSPERRLSLAERIRDFQVSNGPASCVHQRVLGALFPASTGDPFAAWLGQTDPVLERLGKIILKEYTAEGTQDPEMMALLQRLHKSFPKPAVRLALARAWNLSVWIRSDDDELSTMVEAVQTLYDSYGREPEIQKELVGALAYARDNATDPTFKSELARRLRRTKAQGNRRKGPKDK